MFEALENISDRPAPFEYYTAKELWTDEHTSRQMLAFHLAGELDVSSRNTAFIDKSVDWIVNAFHIGMHSRIADFGCGPGLYTTRLAKSGANVTGIDFSKRSIAYAKETAARERLQINYVNQDYLDFETQDRFDLVIMIMCDFCALSPAQRKKLLGKFHQVLAPGGAVLFDVYSLSAFEQRQEAATYEINLLDGFWSREKYYGFLNTFKYNEEKVVLDKYTIVEHDRTRQVFNWLQYFAPEDIENELKGARFSIEGFYSDVAGNQYDSGAREFAVVAART